jgi:hypothetical protein
MPATQSNGVKPRGEPDLDRVHPLLSTVNGRETFGDRSGAASGYGTTTAKGSVATTQQSSQFTSRERLRHDYGRRFSGRTPEGATVHEP